MRPVSILIITVAYITLCQSCNSTGLPINKDDLTGNWMVIRTTTSDDYTYEQITGKNVKDMRKKAEMSIWQFQPNGAGTFDLGQPEYQNFSWTFAKPQQQLTMQYGNQPQENPNGLRPRIFTAKYFKHDSLIIQNVIKDNRLDSVTVRTVFLRLRSNDTVPDLVAPALNKWRVKALQAESDDAIRARTKQLLYYYSAYFASLEFNKITHFNASKILCPVKFYSNGIGLKNFKEDDDWTKVYYDSLDAKKAHDMLGHAFIKTNTYPNKNDETVRVFVIALKMVADKL